MFRKLKEMIQSYASNKEDNSSQVPTYASYPYDGKILEYYQESFEAVYILLHPFYKAVTLDLGHYNSETWPNKYNFIQGCDSITWHEILSLTGLDSISQIDVALRTMIGGINTRVQNKYWEQEILKLYEEQNIINPCDDGYVSPFLENQLLGSLQEIGYEFLLTVDEHGVNEPKKMKIDYLIENDRLDSCNYTEDQQLLFATHWDSHCTFLCSSKKIMDQILEIHSFEGFFCTPKTEVYWGLHDI